MNCENLTLSPEKTELDVIKPLSRQTASILTPVKTMHQNDRLLWIKGSALPGGHDGFLSKPVT